MTMNSPDEIQVIEDPDNPGYYRLDIPEHVLERLGWKPGDVIDVGWDKTTNQLIFTVADK